jgi:hypothetical protein
MCVVKESGPLTRHIAAGTWRRKALRWCSELVNTDGSISASVRPEQIALSEALGSIRGTSPAVHFELDMIPG